MSKEVIILDEWADCKTSMVSMLLSSMLIVGNNRDHAQYNLEKWELEARAILKRYQELKEGNEIRN